MVKKDIIVIGASAGGVEALRTLVAGLPSGFPAAILVVMHMSPQSPGVLANILEQYGKLPATTAFDGAPLRMGHIYVARPDYHLLLDSGDRIRITRGPKENRFRPAIDPLFRSAARLYGPRVIGIVLTGGLDDGTAGMWAIKRCGGMAIVQDPADALEPSMPRSVLRHIVVDHCVPLDEIAPLLVRLTTEPAEEEGEFSVPDEMNIEVKIAMEDNAIDAGVRRLGEFSPFTCPECHGVLLEMKEGDMLRYRCHTGHAFSANSLLADLTENIEESLWTTVRSLEENVMLMRHIADHLKAGNQADASEVFMEKAREIQGRADLVRRAAMNHEKLSELKMKEQMEESESF